MDISWCNRKEVFWLSILMSLFISPLVVIIYPFWVRFSYPTSIWNVAGVAMIMVYPVCAIAAAYSVWRQKLLVFFAYSMPFIEAAFLATDRYVSHALYVAGFVIYSFPQNTFYDHCSLTSASKSQTTYVIGWCRKTTHQGVLGYHGESNMIIYDSKNPQAENLDGSAYKVGDVADINVWNMIVKNHPNSINDNNVQELLIEPLKSNYYYVHMVYLF